MIVYMAAVEHMAGIDLHAALSEKALEAKVAEYCRSHWDTRTCDVLSACEPPEDDRACIERYFDDHENDSLTTGTDCLEGDSETETTLNCEGLKCPHCGTWNLHSECGTYEVLVPICKNCGECTEFHTACS